MAKSKKPKLPKVWIAFSGGGYLAFWLKKPGREDAYLYAPVQKPKVCVWTVGRSGWNITGCSKEETTEGPRRHCPDCGGKIRRKS